MNVLENKKANLDWSDLFTFLERDKQGRWYVASKTGFAREYVDLNNYRTPSVKWPFSHAKPFLTKKFAKWLIANHTEFARMFKLL